MFQWKGTDSLGVNFHKFFTRRKWVIICAIRPTLPRAKNKPVPTEWEFKWVSHSGRVTDKEDSYSYRESIPATQLVTSYVSEFSKIKVHSEW